MSGTTFHPDPLCTTKPQSNGQRVAIYRARRDALPYREQFAERLMRGQMIQIRLISARTGAAS